MILETLASFLLSADFLLVTIAQCLSYCKHESDIHYDKMSKIVLGQNKTDFSLQRASEPLRGILIKLPYPHVNS